MFSRVVSTFTFCRHRLQIYIGHAGSYTFAKHEEQVGELARSMGFTHVSLSSEVMPMVKAVPRGFTTAADAYLTPVIARYVKSFRSGFDQVRVLMKNNMNGESMLRR